MSAGDFSKSDAGCFFIMTMMDLLYFDEGNVHSRSEAGTLALCKITTIGRNISRVRF